MNLIVVLLIVVVAVLVGVGALIGGAALFGLIALAALVFVAWLVWALAFHGREVAEHVREMPTGGDPTFLGPTETSATTDPDAGAADDERSRAA